MVVGLPVERTVDPFAVLLLPVGRTVDPFAAFLLPVGRTVDPFVALLVLLRSLLRAVQVARAQSPVGLVVQVRVCWGLVPLKY